MRRGYRGSVRLLGLFVALRGLVACSGTGSSVNANEDGSPQGTGGTVSAGGTFGDANVGGAGSGGVTGGTSAGGAGGPSTGGVPSSGSGGIAGVPAGGSGGTALGRGGQGGSVPGGSGGTSGAGGSSALFRQVSTVLGKNCGLSGCHADKQSPRFAPDARLYANLTAEDTVLAECDYTKLVEAGDPSRSALVRLMNRKCGTFTMPPTCRSTPCISAADLKALSDWIQAGAPP